MSKKHVTSRTLTKYSVTCHFSITSILVMHFGGWLHLLLAGLAVFAQESTSKTSGEPTQNVTAVTEASLESTKTTTADSDDFDDYDHDGETTATTTKSEDGGESTSGPTTDTTTSDTYTENTFTSSSTAAGDTPPTETSVQTTETATESTTSDLTTKDLETSTIGDDYDVYSNMTIGSVQNPTEGDNGTLVEDIVYDNYYNNDNDTVVEETEDPTSPSFKTSLVAAISTLVIVGLM